MEDKTRYELIKEATPAQLAAILSYYFDCSYCPAKRENCSENDAMCMDAICDWLEQEGQF